MRSGALIKQLSVQIREFVRCHQIKANASFGVGPAQERPRRFTKLRTAERGAISRCMTPQDRTGRRPAAALGASSVTESTTCRNHSLGTTAAVLHWYVTKDGDLTCLALYERHYSRYEYKDGRRQSQFVGPGEHIVLRTAAADAMFVWRKYIDDTIPKQEGVECAVFRNESRILSSELVRQADAVADLCWPGERHYTKVNPEKLRRRHPRWGGKAGTCFIKAGWRRCGMTKGGLLILERESTKPLMANDGDQVKENVR